MRKEISKGKVDKKESNFNDKQGMFFKNLTKICNLRLNENHNLKLYIRK